MTKVYVDGSPKEVCCVSNGKVSRAPIDGENTNNVVEYRAILFGLYKHPEATEVVSDSQLIIKQLSGEYTIRQEHLKVLVNKVRTRVEKLKHEVKFTWVPRGENKAGRILKWLQ